jgi:hypothetical protein
MDTVVEVAEHPMTWVIGAGIMSVLAARARSTARRRGVQCMRARIAQTGETNDSAEEWCESDRPA